MLSTGFASRMVLTASSCLAAALFAATVSAAPAPAPKPTATATAPAANKPAGPPRVAVLDFRTTGEMVAGVGDGVAENLRSALALAGNYVLVERGEIQQVMKEQSLGQTGMVADDQAIKVGHLLGAKMVVVGSVTRLGEVYTLNARMIDAETGVVASARSLKTNSVDGLADLVDQIAPTLGVTKPAAAPRPAPTSTTTASSNTKSATTNTTAASTAPKTAPTGAGTTPIHASVSAASEGEDKGGMAPVMTVKDVLTEESKHDGNWGRNQLLAIVQRAPHNHVALYYLAVRDLHRHDLANAERWLDRILADKPAIPTWMMPWTYVQKGVVTEQLGRVADARQAFQAAIALPDTPSAVNGMPSTHRTAQMGLTRLMASKGRPGRRPPIPAAVSR